MVFQNCALYPHMTVSDNIGIARNRAKEVPRRPMRFSDANAVVGELPVVAADFGQKITGQRLATPPAPVHHRRAPRQCELAVGPAVRSLPGLVRRVVADA